MRKVLAGGLCAMTAAAPAVAFAATNDEANNSSQATTESQTSSNPKELRQEARQKIDIALARARHERHQALARKHARERAKRLAAAPAAPTTTASTTQATGASSAPGNLQAIAACESGGNPSAVGGGGAFRGKYQFDQATWESVGGSGDPAAAPVAEQDKRAEMLLQRSGTNPWPVCGH